MIAKTASNQPEYLIIGRILAPRGLRGEVKVEILTDFPDRFALLDTVYLGEEHTPYTLEQVRRQKQLVLLKFAGLDTREAVEELRGLYVQIPIAQAMPLGPGEYYEHQILGLEVWTEQGRFLGRISEILVTGSNDVYVVSDGGKELLLPALRDVVREVDLGQGRMLVRLLEGLEEMTERVHRPAFGVQ